MPMARSGVQWLFKTLHINSHILGLNTSTKSQSPKHRALMERPQKIELSKTSWHCNDCAQLRQHFWNSCDISFCVNMTFFVYERALFSEVFGGRPANCAVTLQRSCSERQSAASVLAMSPGTCPVKTARWQEKEDCQPCFWVCVVPRQLVVHYSWLHNVTLTLIAHDKSDPIPSSPALAFDKQDNQDDHLTSCQCKNLF